MPQSVAFLRAVNLGSHRKVAMADLRREFEGLGFDDVSTFVNSGNVIFSTGRRGRALERAIEERLRAAIGFDVPTYVRTAAEVHELLAAEPFEVRPGETHLVTINPSQIGSSVALEAKLYLRGHPDKAYRRVSSLPRPG